MEHDEISQYTSTTHRVAMGLPPIWWVETVFLNLITQSALSKVSTVQFDPYFISIRILLIVIEIGSIEIR